MKIKVLTIFPEIINDFCSKSLLGKALNKQWFLNAINIRDYSTDKHKKVDDVPYGGGQGMIMKPDVISNCIEKNCIIGKTKILYMSPRGQLLNQKKIKELMNYDDISIICGRYEGIDERVIEKYSIEEISIGDYVLMGGELASLVLIESLVRCIDGVIGNENSKKEDSFGGIDDNIFNNLLEYPLYTRPEVWNNIQVPQVLLSGNHKNIEKWKIEKSIEITKNRRPDLYKKYLESIDSKKY